MTLLEIKSSEMLINLGPNITSRGVGMIFFMGRPNSNFLALQPEIFVTSRQNLNFKFFRYTHQKFLIY